MLLRLNKNRSKRNSLVFYSAGFPVLFACNEEQFSFAVNNINKDRFIQNLCYLYIHTLKRVTIYGLKNVKYSINVLL